MPRADGLLRSIRTKLVVVYVLLILFALELIGAYFVRTLTASLIRTNTEAALNQAQLTATIIGPELDPGARRNTEPPSLLGSLPRLFDGSVYVLDPQGVVQDTTATSALIGQKRVDSVATQALVERKPATGIRIDPLTQQHFLAVAVPVYRQRQFAGIVENVVPIQSTYDTIRQVTTIYYTSSVLVLLLTALLGIVLSRTLTGHVAALTRQARKLASGDYSQRVAVKSDDEIGDLAAAINDLTDKLEDAIAANARERDRLQAILRYMGDGVVAFDANLQPLFQNDAARRMLSGVPSGQVSRALGIPSPPPAEGERMYIRELDEALIHVHLTAIRRHGEAEGYVALLRDVTKEEKLQQARRDFVANVSHELRTPLTTVKSYVEALLLGDQDAATREQFLRVVDHEADRMVRLTEDLLQLTGLESGEAPLRPVRVDIREWMDRAHRRFALQAQAQGVHLSTESSGRGFVVGDADLLDRLLDNLVSNALHYTPRGGAVRLCAECTGDRVCLTVADTGIGIPKEDLPHVFERFYRVDKARSRRRGGTGLGLALAREIVERHEGTIRIDSELGKGTTVTVHLPLDEEGCR
ncbi:ATP-binding protein [Alicyclobacillus sp.]|uniref:ATP-binding protein n=1 Tax=Alicyclobacillus sp. TaxID=61169 RepID=UPI0025C3A270|nr:ATP-binding protein [Alicyclobacillus sp.]MCL6516028.1 cell wall metabolism sensor histidine kinase WalK [Alicyclobacillus sp.]